MTTICILVNENNMSWSIPCTRSILREKNDIHLRYKKKFFVSEENHEIYKLVLHKQHSKNQVLLKTTLTQYQQNNQS